MSSTEYVGRRALGLVLLTVVVLTWTASNFLNSAILADASYAKPYFVVFVSTAFFAFLLVPWVLRRLYRGSLTANGSHDSAASEDAHSGLLEGNEPAQGRRQVLTTRETFLMSSKFVLLWFPANYLNTACLSYTTVSSTTIFASTSGVWTLVIASLVGVETFTTNKSIGVIATFIGALTIGLHDLDGKNDQGSYPSRTPAQLAVGDIMALFSAILYGCYVTGLAASVRRKGDVDMQLFFGLIGLICLACLWPGFLILHATGIETFEFPPTRRVWTIVLANATACLFADVAWAYSIIMVSPLVVTIGMSLTIPCSLIGDMLINSRFSPPSYWLGAAIVVFAFMLVNHDDNGRRLEH